MRLRRPDRRRGPGTAWQGGEQALDYERGRPSYPAELLELLARELPIGPGTRVLDLAAGTGKLTRALLDAGAETVAVEPVPSMREALRQGCPGADVREGTAERIPLPDAAVDAVTVAQAFHWFEPGPALAELNRVLRPGGGLALVWLLRDTRVGWVRELNDTVRRFSPGKPAGNRQRRDWAAVLDAHGHFGPVAVARLRHAEPQTAATLLARVASTSHVAALSPRQRARCLNAVAQFVRRNPELAGRDGSATDLPDFPHEAVVYWCHRR